jgi:hypothetical protein
MLKAGSVDNLQLEGLRPDRLPVLPAASRSCGRCSRSSASSA